MQDSAACERLHARVVDRKGFSPSRRAIRRSLLLRSPFNSAIWQPNERAWPTVATMQEGHSRAPSPGPEPCLN